jgi:hypothetical protein
MRKTIPHYEKHFTHFAGSWSDVTRFDSTDRFWHDIRFSHGPEKGAARKLIRRASKAKPPEPWDEGSKLNGRAI